ncbi:MAG TPA: hypothetical protein VFS08_05960, partial [Gemmatimonadaceae bacterium]|nr:hypothetical protein [Gemmatimonadaceae bacterium]
RRSRSLPSSLFPLPSSLFPRRSPGTPPASPPATMPDDPARDPWTHHMLRGDFEAAWVVSDRVLRERAGAPTWHLPRHLQSLWDGSPLTGRRVLVRCYHGLGDTIQFVRFLPRLRAQAAEVTLWAQPALLPLLRTARGVDRLLPLHDGTPQVDHDADVEIMELAHVFRVTPRGIPRRVPYLHAPPAPLVRDDGLHVGVVWQSGGWNAERRTIPCRLLAPLAAIPDVTLHALQRGPPLDDWPAAFGPVSGSDDVLAAAGVMRALDLVLTVDSFPAHLAGALGVPVWTLLHAECDWRWMATGRRSPWYPTMRLFRQPTPGAWEPVIAAVAAALRRLARRRTAREVATEPAARPAAQHAAPLPAGTAAAG